jgi:hypothetical protein
MDDTLQSTIELALILLLVIFAVAVVVEWIKLPSTIALLLADLFGIQRGFHDIYLTPDLILLVFLPVLLFEEPTMCARVASGRTPSLLDCLPSEASWSRRR